MKMNTKLTAERKWRLGVAVVVALTLIAIALVAWNTHSTRAEVDCTGDWWNSTDPTTFTTCLGDQGPKDVADFPSDAATAAARPGTPDADADYTPVPLLPIPTDFTAVYPITYTPDLSDPIPPIYSGVTTLWRDGGVPADDYMSWNMLFVLTRPGNGATYAAIGTDPQVTVTVPSNPTIETLVGSTGDANNTYQKVWTDPNADGALYITNVTNPAYTNTDPNVPYPGPKSVVYFTTQAGETGHFDISTGTWTFDPILGALSTPTPQPTYP